MLEVDRLAALGAVEVDDMQPFGAFFGERARRRQRLLVIDGLRLEVALAQPHGVAAEDVDRRVEVHACVALGSRAATQICAKFASRRRPAAEDFSAWNWTP